MHHKTNSHRQQSCSSGDALQLAPTVSISSIDTWFHNMKRCAADVNQTYEVPSSSILSCNFYILYSFIRFIASCSLQWMRNLGFRNIWNRVANAGPATLDPKTLATSNPKILACLKKSENLSFVSTCKFSL